MNQLIEASGSGNVARVRKLLESGVDPNIHEELGVTALIAASSEGHAYAAKILIDYGAKMTTMCATSVGSTPALSAKLIAVWRRS